MNGTTYPLVATVIPLEFWIIVVLLILLFLIPADT
jgi:hypothetical protein